jgi:sugar phosphate permease
MGTAELGLWLGLIWGLGGMAGVLLGGYVAERWFTGDERGQMRVVAGVIASLVPCYALVLFLPQKQQALTAMIPLVLAGNFIFGPIFALMQRLVLDEMRATTLALVMLLANLIGMGVGPQAVGLLSDWLMPVLGSDSLRYAMLTISLLALWSAYHFWLAGRTVSADLSTVAPSATSHRGAPDEIIVEALPIRQDEG